MVRRKIFSVAAILSLTEKSDSFVMKLIPHIMLTLACLGFNFTQASEYALESVVTSLNPKSCQIFYEEDDPNDTPQLICPGISGYQIIIRATESGRSSLDVITPEKDIFELDFQGTVTQAMLELTDQVTWLTSITNNKTVPVALAVPVRIHGNIEKPELVTEETLVLVKLGKNDICVVKKYTSKEMSFEKLKQLGSQIKQMKCVTLTKH